MMKLNELFGLDGKIALVTGGSRGIGKMIVEGLLEAGCAKVYIVARKKEQVDETSAELGDKDKIAARTKDYEDRFANPFVAAERGFIDEVIRPHSTRRRVARAFASLRGKKLANPWKKHDNIPL